jgi:hypothetical protein
MKNCHVCGAEVKGNLSSAERVAFKCAACLNGEVEHIRANPDKFPEAFKRKAKPIVNLRKSKSKLPKGTTLATC